MVELCPSYSVHADWVLPVDRPAIRDGVVTVIDGRIAAVRPYSSRESSSRETPLVHVDGVLLPGLINTHTHLEFSGFAEPWGTPGEPFHAWLTQIIARRRQLQNTPIEQAAAQRAAVTQGLAESHAAGVAVVGEIAGLGAEGDWLRTAPRPEVVVSFKELLGLASDTVEPLLADARAHLAAVSDDKQTIAGLSPHAPYSVNLELLRGAVALSKEFRAPLAMHLAESAEELELLQSHSGPLVEVLKSINRWFPGELPRGIRPMDYLELLAGADRALVVHGNFLARDEIRFVGQQTQMSVVYCPRTQARFDHGPYPLAEMLAAGVRVAIGTDSRSSNPDLSLWRELQHIAANHPSVSPEEILKLGALNGAEALGVERDWGSLTVGKRAVMLQAAVDEVAEPLESLFAGATPRRF